MVAAPSPSEVSAGPAATTERTPGSRASRSSPPGNASTSSLKIDSRWTRRLSSAGAAEREDPAAVDDRDPVAELVGLGHVVRRQEDRATGNCRTPRPHVLADLARGPDIQPEGRLVEEQDPRVVEKAARQVQLLALARGERGDPVPTQVGDPDQLGQLVDAAPALPAPEPVELAEHPELLADREDPVAGLLAAGDHVHDPADPRRLADDVEPGDPGAPRGREEEGREDLDERGLARPVGPEQPEELAGGRRRGRCRRVQ